MMNPDSLPALLQTRDALFCAAQEIVDLAVSECRSLRAEEFARVESLRERAAEVTTRIQARREERRCELLKPQRY